MELRVHDAQHKSQISWRLFPAGMRGRLALVGTIMAVILVVVPGKPLGAQSLSLGPKLWLGASLMAGNDWPDQFESRHMSDSVDTLSETYSYGRHLAYAVGLVLDIGLHRNFSVVLEGMLSHYGWKYQYETEPRSDGASGEAVYTLMRLPILLKVKAPLTQRGTLFAVAGPALALFLTDITYWGDDVSGGWEYDTESPASAVIITADIGIGYEHALGPGIAALELRFDRTYSELLDGMDTSVEAYGIHASYRWHLQ